MSENSCGRCKYYKGNNNICSDLEQKRRVSFHSPICWGFKPSKIIVILQEWKGEPTSEKWTK